MPARDRRGRVHATVSIEARSAPWPDIMTRVDCANRLRRDFECGAMREVVAFGGNLKSLRSYLEWLGWRNVALNVEFGEHGGEFGVWADAPVGVYVVK